MNSIERAALRTFGGAVCITFSPILVKTITLPPTTSPLFRCLIGGVVLLLASLGQIKTIKIESILKSTFILTLPALFFSLDLFFWHKSIVISGAGMATILANTQVFYLTLIGIAFFKERPRHLFYVGFFFAIIGISLLVAPQWSFGNQSSTGMGVIYGLLTGVLYTAYMLSLRKVGRSTLSGSLFLGCISIICAIWLTIIGFAEGTLETPSLSDWPGLLGLGFISQALGWWLIATSLKYVPIARAGLILLAQPALATILGWLIYQEHLTLWQSVGAILTLIGIYLGNRSK